MKIAILDDLSECGFKNGGLDRFGGA